MPEPLGDTESDLVAAFEALNELSWQYFVGRGWTTAKIEIAN